jgi:hypothetical protein
VKRFSSLSHIRAHMGGELQKPFTPFTPFTNGGVTGAGGDTAGGRVFARHPATPDNHGGGESEAGRVRATDGLSDRTGKPTSLDVRIRTYDDETMPTF